MNAAGIRQSRIPTSAAGGEAQRGFEAASVRGSSPSISIGKNRCATVAQGHTIPDSAACTPATNGQPVAGVRGVVSARSL